MLQHIYAANAHLGAQVIIPPGDDMGGIAFAGQMLLAAVDQVIDGRHFRLATTPIALVGRKAVARCLSDVAAMAGAPLCALAAAVLPSEFSDARANELFDAMRAMCDAYSCPLIGGDIAFHAGASHPLTISVTVLASPSGGRAITRSGAAPGDGVYVTGSLGGSLERDGLGRHLTFEPRIQLALELAATLGDRLHAMIDLSDGLGRDAGSIAAMSGVQMLFDANAIPCNPGNDWRAALRDGEDYELLFCATGPLPAQLAGALITRIGDVAANSKCTAPRVLVRDGSHTIAADELGWEHASP